MRKASSALIALGLLVLLALVVVARWPYQWPLVVAGCLILGLGVLCVVSVKRRWPVAVSVAAGFAAAFLLFMPIGCVSGAPSGAAGVGTTCQNVVGLSLPGFSGRGPGFSPSYWTPLAVGGVAAVVAFVVDRRRRRRPAAPTT